MGLRIRIHPRLPHFRRIDSLLSHTGGFIYRILSLAPLRLLGRYSYGFYVYHVLLAPVLWLKLSRSSAATAASASFVVEFLIIFAVSAISYHFLERPFLHLKAYFGSSTRTSNET